MTHPYDFGISQEDDRSEVAALRPGPSDTVLVVASAGDMPLSLLAAGAGAAVAIDPSPGQLRLGALKVAAIAALDREDAIRYLGFLPARDRIRIHREVRLRLDPETRAFWDGRTEIIRSGAIHAGRFERFARRLMRALRPVLSRRAIEGLFACSSTAEQEEWFDRRIDGKPLCAAFHLAFAPWVFRRRGVDERSLAHRDPESSVARVYHERFRRMCTATPAPANHFLQTLLLGRVLGPDAVPAYLTREGFPTARAGRLSFVRADLAGWLGSAPPGSFGLAQLSNTPDWMSQSDFESVLSLLATRIGPPGRAVWRLLHADRPVPASLAPRFAVDGELGRALERTDRYPFYRIVPATIAPAAGPQ